MVSKETHRPAVNLEGREIVQVGIVVADAAKTARRYAEVFGIGPWIFIDMEPTDLVLHDEPLGEAESCVRIAMADLGRLQIELLQPLYGPGTHMEFLKTRGEGVHHVSFGVVEDHDRIVSALKGRGIGIEMQGVLGGAYLFTYLSTQGELGTIFEVVKRINPDTSDGPVVWGTYDPPKPGAVALNKKEIVQLGVVVKDAEGTAKRYWEIFGVGPWVLVDFTPPHLGDGVLHGIRMRQVDFHIRAALANLGSIQIELIQPVCGPSTHMEFLRSRGVGVHHLSFGELKDHDEMLSALQALGFEVEMTGLLGGAATFTYMATQRELGTIFEIVKAHPGVRSSLVPYGSYPPAKR